MADNEKKFDKVKYKNDFNREKYDRISLMLPKGNKEIIKAYADSKGETVNGFIKRAIDETMERDNQ